MHVLALFVKIRKDLVKMIINVCISIEVDRKYDSEEEHGVWLCGGCLKAAGRRGPGAPPLQAIACGAGGHMCVERAAGEAVFLG